jgi:small GTP-binding protein
LAARLEFAHLFPHEGKECAMPMPHRTQMQVIKRRLVGKVGAERLRELRAILEELPNYKSGPYADIRKWVKGEIAVTRTRARIVHRDSIAIRREGSAQVALVGPPNAGKSSLLQALSEIQIRTGDYAFTTTRPVPALTRIEGVLIQLVEIPGLIQGAGEGRGGGRALLGVLRGADAAVLCHDVTAPLDGLETVRGELSAAGISPPMLLAATKADEAPHGALDCLTRAYPDLEVVAVSVLDDASLDVFRTAVWRLTGLIRIFLRHLGEIDANPVALRPPVTVHDVAAEIHHELARRCQGARVWGPSAAFAGQRVGRGHRLEDGDVVEIID